MGQEQSYLTFAFVALGYKATRSLHCKRTRNHPHKSPDFLDSPTCVRPAVATAYVSNCGTNE